MSERMWIAEQLEKARTERDQAILDRAIKDAEIASLREPVSAMREATLDECEKLIQQYQAMYSHRPEIVFIMLNIQDAIAALKRKGSQP